MLHVICIPIAVVLGLLATIAYIMLLVKLFKHGGVGLGILGLCVSPFTYVWGWVKSTELGLKKLMITLTLLILGSSFAGVGVVAKLNTPEVKAKAKLMQDEFNKQVQEAQKQQSANQR